MSNKGNSPLAQRRAMARRVIIGVLVLVCVISITVYGRETNSGALHRLQDGAGTVVTPIQDGVSRAVQPVRNAWGWLSGLVSARDRAAHLAQENQLLRGELVQLQFNAEEGPRIAKVVGLGTEWRADYSQVPAMIIVRSPSPWYAQARIDKGTNDGVVVNSPVLAAGDVGTGLVGVITQAGPISSVVSFISDPQTSVGVTIVGASGAIGLLQPTAPGAFQITGIPVTYPVATGDPVLTAGFSQAGLQSIYPRGIPIGVVQGVGHRAVDVQQTVQLVPFVNTDSLAYVVVLAPKSALAKQRAATP
jgi:rod shape-determining protein MreC